MRKLSELSEAERQVIEELVDKYLKWFRLTSTRVFPPDDVREMVLETLEIENA